ncbi:MAG TPA: YHS domain-containing protein [Nitrospiria bacterium]|nr:YHS domain-containing protein [Nitrospiria bacterium]
MVKDLVCGMQVDEKKAAGTSNYKGQIYYFCSVSCKVKFEKKPENFIKQ